MSKRCVNWSMMSWSALVPTTGVLVRRVATSRDATLAIADRENAVFGEQMRQITCALCRTAILPAAGVIRKQALILIRPDRAKIDQRNAGRRKSGTMAALCAGILRAALHTADGPYVKTAGAERAFRPKSATDVRMVGPDRT